jgi:hypothetical protein
MAGLFGQPAPWLFQLQYYPPSPIIVVLRKEEIKDVVEGICAALSSFY